MDERLNVLSRWVERAMGMPVALEPASADASFRRYFRVYGGEDRTYIAMDAPPPHESVETFARVAGRFAEAGLNVPVVYALDTTRGFALLSDLGDRTFLAALRSDESGHQADALYADALEALWRLQAASRNRQAEFEPYDADKLTREMELFREWFVPCRTSHTLSEADHGVVDRTFRLLVENALEQPKVWVHRDFHSRNLMVTAARNPGVLDFQDAVTGPVTYDLVSLLRDCYITWPTARLERWLMDYFDRLRGTVIPAGTSAEQFTLWFDWMGVQRHTKVLGIFTRLYHRDGKPDYLGDLPVVYDYVRDVCSRYPELVPFRDLLESMEIAWTS